MCCNNINYGSNVQAQVPQTTTGTNQKLIKQIEDQQRQQQAIQQVIQQQSVNPNKTFTKTYN